MQESQLKPTYLCWICGKAVDLKTCKTDDHGMAVHEECYALKVTLAIESRRLTDRKPAHRVIRPLPADGPSQSERRSAN